MYPKIQEQQVTVRKGHVITTTETLLYQSNSCSAPKENDLGYTVAKINDVTEDTQLRETVRSLVDAQMDDNSHQPLTKGTAVQITDKSEFSKGLNQTSKTSLAVGDSSSFLQHERNSSFDVYKLYEKKSSSDAENMSPKHFVEFVSGDDRVEMSKIYAVSRIRILGGKHPAGKNEKQTKPHNPNPSSNHSGSVRVYDTRLLDKLAYSVQKSVKGSQTSERRRRKRSQTSSQRSAANMRERRRMCHLNDAFETLKVHLPNVAETSRLSRIQTLKAAIAYIKYLVSEVEGD